ncbi:MAG: helical backbone metal receptor [Acidimicrobiales bacterium]|jgi:ABC-type Fe3+-hydroxamate transport system substrate-binding protein
MPTLHDDLGRRVHLERPPTRLVSLVPSLTEALAATVPERLVGATDYCSHTGTVEPVRVRGTKNPDHAAIGRLAPDLVVANREENRQVDVDRLAGAGIPVWVTVIDSLDDAFGSFRRLFGDVLGVAVPPWAVDAEREWSRPADLPGVRTLAPIWRDPWMVVGPATFAGDVLQRLGLVNVGDGERERYPKRSLEQLTGLGPELVLLPDEPYAFSATDGPEAFTGVATALVSGRNLTWYGPSLVSARRRLTDAVVDALGLPGGG